MKLDKYQNCGNIISQTSLLKGESSGVCEIIFPQYMKLGLNHHIIHAYSYILLTGHLIKFVLKL